jgi:GT2 family glycosyltransferase
MWGVGSDRSIGRNNVVKAALEEGTEWVLFLDDDQTFPPDILMRLLEHDRPIVGGLYVQRGAPFYPIAYTSILEDGSYLPLNLVNHPTEGLVKVVGLGTGGMLIRAEVFHALSDAGYDGEWFTHTTEKSEDLMFCDRAIEAGFEVFVDVSARMGHTAPASVQAVVIGGEWHIGWIFNESAKMHQRVGEVAVPSPIIPRAIPGLEKT